MLIHDWLGRAVVIVAAIGVVGAVVSVFRPQVLRPLRLYIRCMLAAVAVQALIGIVLFATGSRPQQVLHIFYGIATLVALPFSMWMGGPLKDRDKRLWLVGGAVATLLFALRAVMTG
jgi:heme A synthase